MALHAAQQGPNHIEGLLVAHVGCFVMLGDVDTGEVETYELVPDGRSDLNRHRLSVDSPLGRMLVGREEGAWVTVGGLSPPRTLEILDIERSLYAPS